MRCKSCDSRMHHSPMFVKLEDGTIIPNELCNSCSADADENLDHLEYAFADAQFAKSYAYVKTEHKRREWN